MHKLPCRSHALVVPGLACLSLVLAGCASVAAAPTVAATAAPAAPVAQAAPAPAARAATAPAPAASGAAATPPALGQPPLFATVIKDAKQSDGLIAFWQKDEKVWLELKPEDFGKPFLLSPKRKCGSSTPNCFTRHGCGCSANSWPEWLTT